jgi:hypothetical protein
MKVWVVIAVWGEYEDRGWEVIGVYSSLSLCRAAEEQATKDYGGAETFVLDVDGIPARDWEIVHAAVTG